MFDAFGEAVRATAQPCTFLLVAPTLAGVMLVGATGAALGAALVAAILGGWLLAGNWWVLDGGWLQVSAALLLAGIVVVAASYRVDRLEAIQRPATTAGVAFTTTLLASLWWRPCVGEELGSILTSSQRDVVGQLPATTAYMLGTMVPVIALVLVVRAIEPRRPERLAFVAATLGFVIAGSLVLGRHDTVIVTLTRWST
jgi:cytochrome c-type biogenesis protein